MSSIELNIAIGPGEAYDRLSILEIKASKFEGEKLEVVQRQKKILEDDIEEYHRLHPMSMFSVKGDRVRLAYRQLLEINSRLWRIEDKIRAKEAAQEFDDEFIELARGVYHVNDERSAQKRAIDEECGSLLAEQKGYTEYEKDSSAGKSV